MFFGEIPVQCHFHNSCCSRVNLFACTVIRVTLKTIVELYRPNGTSMCFCYCVEFIEIKCFEIKATTIIS